MQVTLMLNEDSNGSLDREELMQRHIWTLQNELCRKALTISRLYHQPIEYFHVSEAYLRELPNDKQRVALLRMRLTAVDAMLADGQGSSAEPSGPHETAARTADPVQPAPLLPCTSNPPHLIPMRNLQNQNEESWIWIIMCKSTTGSSLNDPRNRPPVQPAIERLLGPQSRSVRWIQQHSHCWKSTRA